MDKLLIINLLLFLISGCNAQNRPDETPVAQIGGPCEGCENFDVEKPPVINETDTSLAWENGKAQLIIYGKIQNRLGGPVRNVEVFYWHTNAAGKYEMMPKGAEAKSIHPYPHGWVKTNELGEFNLYTIRPGAYPGRNIPAHIHLFVKEPDLPNAYYVDDLVFDDDKLVNTTYRKSMQNRGGSGVLRPLKMNNVLTADYAMVMGLNIPDHPDNIPEISGLPVGFDSPSFRPYHAWGNDKGTRTCPVCKYGQKKGILHFTDLPPGTDEVEKWARLYEKLSVENQGNLKVYIIAAGGNEQIEAFENLGRKLGIKHIALTVVPSFDNIGSEVDLNRISTGVTTTIVMYENSRITHKLIDVKPTSQTVDEIKREMDWR